DTVAINRAMAVQEALTDKVKALWDQRKMGPPPPGGVEWEVQSEGAKKMIAPPYHAKNRRVEVTLIRTGAPLPQPDTLDKRIERALDILNRVGLKPDATGKRTERTKCILTKLKPPASGIEDLFVDGKASNMTIGGHHVGFWICSWKGNYNTWKDPN